ncbi:hypothetical protein ACFL6H_08320 [Candidatus Latescibacterota bacterium]
MGSSNNEIEFFRYYHSFCKRLHNFELIPAFDDYFFTRPGMVYAVHLSNNRSTELSLLKSYKSPLTVLWYNPHSGSDIENGPPERIR